MNPLTVTASIGAIFILFIGSYVFSQKANTQLGRSFGVFCLSFFTWLSAYAAGFSLSDERIALFWFRLGYMGVIFIPVTSYHFGSIFLNIRKHKEIVYLAYALGGVFVALLWFSQLLVPGLHHYSWGFYPKAGKLHPAFLTFFMSLLSGVYVLLLIAYLQKKKNQLTVDSKRIMHVFWALAIGNFAAIDFVPNYGVSIIPLGFLFMVAMVSIFGYSILTHQLMDIQVIIRRTAVFAGMALGMMAMIAVPTVIAQTWLGRIGTISPMILNLIGVVLIMLTYERMKTWLVNATERFLFQKKYDYRVLLKKFTDEVMVMVDLKQLVQMTVTTLSETIKLDQCTLLLLNKDTRTYGVAASRSNGRPVTLEEQEPFITFLRETHEPIGQDGALGKVRFPDAVTNRMKEFGARLCLPLNLHEDLIGVLCLGKKKSDEEFTPDDLAILLPLAKTLAIAISNAQLFEELAKTQAEAAQKEKLAVIGTLSAGINHEICNPLGIVKAQCEAFLLDGEDGILIGKSASQLLERMSNIMRVALKQIDRATAITQKLSNFAKPIKEPTNQPVAVEQEVDEVLLLVGHDLELGKITVKKEIEPDLPPILADRRQLQEVLFNLVRNAGQAIAPPGTIVVRAREQPGGVRIEIEDTGSGIAPDKLGKIYDPFFTTKEPGKGTGLGLFIVRQIIERNHGRISVESTVGKGTTFFLDFPAAKEAAASAGRR